MPCTMQGNSFIYIGQFITAMGAVFGIGITVLLARWMGREDTASESRAALRARAAAWQRRVAGRLRHRRATTAEEGAE